LVYLPLIAANLAIFNLLPFPALDGGHTLFTTIEWIRGKPINRNIEATIHFVGLILIFAFVIFLDLYHFLG
ncbi:MAG: site-2 protease family protein, partial [Clostridia bacterium]|nr:site-2 protease family protein [Clostridia bacterium]